MGLKKIKNGLDNGVHHNQAVFSVGSKYGNNSVKLKSLLIENESVPLINGNGQAYLTITLERIKKAIKSKNISKKILIQVTATSGNISKCYSDLQQSILTAKKEACIALDGIYNEVTGNCILNCTANNKNAALSTYCLQQRVEGDLDDRWVNIDGDTMTGSLNINNKLIVKEEVTVQKSIHATQTIKTDLEFCVGQKCRNYDAKTCMPGQMVTKIHEDGSLECKGINCANTKYFQGFDPSGNQVCKSLPTKVCSTDQYISEIKSDGSVTCKNIPYSWGITCSKGQYIQQISPSGVPTCVTLKQPQTITCTEGSIYKYNSSTGKFTCRENKNVFNKYCTDNDQSNKTYILKGFDSSGQPICSPVKFETKFILNKSSFNIYGEHSFKYTTAKCPSGYRLTGCSGYLAAGCWSTGSTNLSCDYKGSHKEYVFWGSTPRCTSMAYVGSNKNGSMTVELYAYAHCSRTY